MRWKCSAFWAIPIIAGVLNLNVSATNAHDALKLGILDCDLSAGVGLIFVQKQTMTCTYTPNHGGQPDYYVGKVEEFGIELGATAGGALTWLVLSVEKGV